MAASLYNNSNMKEIESRGREGENEYGYWNEVVSDICTWFLASESHAETGSFVLRDERHKAGFPEA